MAHQHVDLVVFGASWAAQANQRCRKAFAQVDAVNRCTNEYRYAAAAQVEGLEVFQVAHTGFQGDEHA